MSAPQKEMPTVGTAGTKSNTEATTSTNYAKDWAFWLDAFGLDVLPAVADPTPPAAGKLAEDEANTGRVCDLCKTPSGIDANGRRHRIGHWQIEPTGADAVQRCADIERWRRDPRLNVLLVARKVRVIDIDVDDPAEAQRLTDLVCSKLSCIPPMRWREGTGKRSLFVQVQGNRFMHKAVAHLPGVGAVEFLGQRQQSLVEGVHANGSRYHWSGLNRLAGLAAFPVVSEDAMQAAAGALGSALRFGDTPVEPTQVATADPVVDHLNATGRVHGHTARGVAITCPWESEHTSGHTGDGSTVWLLATDQHPAKFHCSHAHCAERRADAFLDAVGYTGDRGHVAGVRSVANASVFTGVPAPAGFGAADMHIPFGAVRGGGGRYRLQTAREFVARPAVEWFIRDVMPRRGVAVVYGPSRAGKTFVVLDMVMTLLSTAPAWHSHRIRNRPSGVVYLAMEGAHGVRGRVRAWSQYQGSAEPESLLFMEGQAFNLANAQDVSDLVSAALSAVGPGCIVVVDTQAKAATGVDEQSARDTGLIYNAAEQIARQLDGLCLLVAHTGKDETKGLRGSSAQTGAADLMMLVSRVDEESGVRRWCIMKNKDGPEDTEGYFELDAVRVGVDEDGEPVESAVVVAADEPVQTKRRARRSPAGGMFVQALTALGGRGDVRSLRAKFIELYQSAHPDAAPNTATQMFSRGAKSSGAVETSPGVWTLPGSTPPSMAPFIQTSVIL